MNQTVLTTLQTIEGWLENLSAYVTQLERQLRTVGVDLRLLEAEAANSLLQGLTGTLRTIVDSLRANGRQIAHEVGEYRTTKDAAHAQTRLRRLIDLYDTHLEPVGVVMACVGRMNLVRARRAGIGEIKMQANPPLLIAKAIPKRLAQVFQLLRQGKHVCRDDGTAFRDLERHEDPYRVVFQALGYQLIRQIGASTISKGTTPCPPCGCKPSRYSC